MKRFFIAITVIMILVTFVGCKKFLSQVSQNQIVPGTTNDLVALMDAEGYPYSNTKICVQLNLVSDDVQCNGAQGVMSGTSSNYKFNYAALSAGKPAFTWATSMFEDMKLNGTLNSNCWSTLYQRISRCNIVIDYIDKVKGSEDAKNNILGQALAARGYYYFLLVNLFGQPYNAIDPEKSPGVPLKLDMYATDSNYVRSSVAEVYRQVETDLKNGAALMNSSPEAIPTPYHLNNNAAYGLLSRMYLYQEKWDSAIVYADKVIANRPQLANLNTFPAPGNAGNGYYSYNFNAIQYSPFNYAYSPEVLWVYNPTYKSATTGANNMASSTLAPTNGESDFFISAGIPAFSASQKPPFAVSDSLLHLYDSHPQSDTNVYLGDLRSRIYFPAVGYLAVINGALGYGFNFYYASTGGKGIRTAEVYLNRAEAYIRKFIAGAGDNYRTLALNDLNTLRVSRYDNRKTYTLVDIADGNQLLKFYQDERRRELPFEGQRWFDLRRYGMPEISHWYEEAPGTGQTYTLSQGDPRYTFPIPQEVSARNGAL